MQMYVNSTECLDCLVLFSVGKKKIKVDFSLSDNDSVIWTRQSRTRCAYFYQFFSNRYRVIALTLGDVPDKLRGEAQVLVKRHKDHSLHSSHD